MHERNALGGKRERDRDTETETNRESEREGETDGEREPDTPVDRQRGRQTETRQIGPTDSETETYREVDDMHIQCFSRQRWMTTMGERASLICVAACHVTSYPTDQSPIAHFHLSLHQNHSHTCVSLNRLLECIA